MGFLTLSQLIAFSTVVLLLLIVMIKNGLLCPKFDWYCLLSGGCIMYTLSCITEAKCADFPSDHSILLYILLWCTEMCATQFIISISSLSRCFYPKCLIVCSFRIKTLSLASLVSCCGSLAMCVLWCDDLNAFPEVSIKRI